MNLEATFMEVKRMILRMPDRNVIFDTPIRVKRTPHSPVVDVFGVSAREEGMCFMDEEGEWHRLYPAQGMSDLIVASIYQRLKLQQYAKS